MHEFGVGENKFVEADFKNHAQNTLEKRGPYSLVFFFILVFCIDIQMDDNSVSIPLNK